MLRTEDRESTGVYFNSNWNVGVYFTLTWRSFPVDLLLWDVIPADQIKRTDRQYPNIRPKPGKQRQALKQLLGIA